MLLFISGLPISSVLIKNTLFTVGAAFLAISAIYEREYFFASLEIIATINSLLVLFAVSIWINFSVLLVLGVGAVVMIGRSRTLDLQLVVGTIGLFLLSGGIILSANGIMAMAGLVLCLYSVLSVRQGFKTGWIFLVLNIAFTATALLSFLAQGK